MNFGAIRSVGEKRLARVILTQGLLARRKKNPNGDPLGFSSSVVNSRSDGDSRQTLASGDQSESAEQYRAGPHG